MSLINNFGDSYFANKAKNIEINRCPKCNIGMVIDTPYDRQCPKCGYTDSSNVMLKVKLKFKIYQELTKHNIRECTVVAEEPDGKISFQRDFVDVITAQSYLDLLAPICLQ